MQKIKERSNQKIIEFPNDVKTVNSKKSLKKNPVKNPNTIQEIS